MTGRGEVGLGLIVVTRVAAPRTWEVRDRASPQSSPNPTFADFLGWKVVAWSRKSPPKAFLVTPQLQLHPSACSDITGGGSVYVKLLLSSAFRGVNGIKTVI